MHARNWPKTGKKRIAIDESLVCGLGESQLAELANDNQGRSLGGLGTSQVFLGEGNLVGTWIPEIKLMETQTTVTWHLKEM